MNQNRNPTKRFFSNLLAKRMLIGAALALMLIGVFLFGVSNPDPEWGQYWMIRPLLIVPFAGAVGGGFYYFMEQQGFRDGIRLLSIIISLFVYVIGLWMGFVLGLAGTLWN